MDNSEEKRLVLYLLYSQIRSLSLQGIDAGALAARQNATDQIKLDSQRHLRQKVKVLQKCQTLQKTSNKTYGSPNQNEGAAKKAKNLRNVFSVLFYQNLSSSLGDPA